MFKERICVSLKWMTFAMGETRGQRPCGNFMSHCCCLKNTVLSVCN